MRTIIATAVLAIAAGACTHPRTPEGHEGYVYNVPLMFGKAEYRDTLRGPSSTGVSWRLYVTNIDMRTKSYKEEFRLLTRDNLSVQFEVNTRIRIRPGTVREIVEEWGEANWYEWNVKETLRTIVRTSVTEVSAIDIQIKTENVRLVIEERLLTKYKDTPIMIESVDIGNIRFPEKVMAAIERKIGQQQELARQEFLVAKTQKEAAIRVLTALKEAKQQLIISETLDSLYLQRVAVDVYGKIAKSHNKTIVVLPNSPKGTGMPLVLSSGKRKALTPADEKMLKEMEVRYMKIARGSSGGGEAGEEPKP
jgi:regulator of protease activity HflC (stomatin/prohibitin superfamily)